MKPLLLMAVQAQIMAAGVNVNGAGAPIRAEGGAGCGGRCAAGRRALGDGVGLFRQLGDRTGLNDGPGVGGDRVIDDTVTGATAAGG